MRPKTPSEREPAARFLRRKVFQPVRKFENEYWHKACSKLNICHRIDAKEPAKLRHDAASLQFGLNICPQALS